jgi:hypothetical protein
MVKNCGSIAFLLPTVLILFTADHLTVDDIAEEEGITPQEVEIG